MTEREALKLALEAFERMNHEDSIYAGEFDFQINAIKEALAQPEQEPVAMKFKIYKPTVPDPTRQGINNALLPWVYDQDRSSGFDATMWVTPVATLPPQRKPLTDEELRKLADKHLFYQPEGYEVSGVFALARAIEAAHGIKENT